MKIVINAYQHSSSITGTDRMAYNFLRELQKIDQTNNYTIVCSRESYTRSAITAPNFRVIAPLQIPHGGLGQRVYNKLWRILLPYRLRLRHAEVYLSFHNMSLPPLRIAKRIIAFNLDLIPIRFEEYAQSQHETQESMLEKYLSVAKLADHFVSISNFSKKELCADLSIDPVKVTTIYLSTDESFNESPGNDTTPLQEKYIFTVGGSEPRKKVGTVLSAYKLLPESLRQNYKLLIAGGKWHGRKLEGADYPGVVELGYVPDESLPGLYQGASAFVFASEYEGFGFTLLEAMASGTPVINARGSSLDEVAGNATLTFEPKDPVELAKKITELLSSETLQKELVQKGYEQNKKFSWEKSARQLHKILTEI